jgi:hypothetical protein
MDSLNTFSVYGNFWISAVVGDLSLSSRLYQARFEVSVLFLDSEKADKPSK